MDSTVRAKLHDLVLKARGMLTEEVRELLEGVYGLGPDGTEIMPAIDEPEVRETRERLDTFLADEAEAGLRGKEAVDRLVGEVAYTDLNRLVAFKMLEARGLIRGTLDKLHASNAFLFYLNDHPEDYDRYNQGDHPKDQIGEGPRDVAYRRFLLDQCSHLSGEVRSLFDPDDLPSHLFPRPRVLRDLIELLNAPEVAEAWAPGSDETLGWVYQYFNEQEKAGVFDRLYNKKQKIRAQDVPAATQLFTPRWIVRQLVHNTLGRLWVEMHPDSRLAEGLDYLVPLAGDTPPQPVKPVREITALDPACGTMHFGLVAFDLFAQMYREEIEHAGEPGWPEESSVTNEAEIPAAILRNNLFGMDIDLRAVQLSALTLYLKAKSLNPKASITASNLACADVRLPPDDRIEDLIREASLGRPVYERLLRAAWKRLCNTSVAGSLVRVEEDVAALIEEERERFNREGLQPDLSGDAAGFGEEVTTEGFWEGLKHEIFAAFDDYARRRTETGDDESYFVGEAREGMRILDVMLRRYDVVVANPPYLSRRNMNKPLADFLGGAYPASKGDLYAAFIERCCELLDEGGRVGMITQQSFMFISSYEKLRTGLLEDQAIEAVCHVGPRAFAEIGGEKVNTVMFVLSREGEERQGDHSIGTYFRLTREPDAKAKRLGFERALSQLESGGEAAAVFRYRQGDLRSIPGTPWVYWITPGLRHLFERLPNLKGSSPPRQGLATADNFRFLRYWWEVGESETARGYRNGWEANESGERWFPYMKGGEFRRWYGNQELTVNWASDGLEMRSFDPSVIRNPGFYFQRGVTWSDLTTGRFAARLSPAGFVFDVKGSSAFPSNAPMLLGILNSGFAHFTLSLLNPTASFQVGDLSRLPIPDSSSDTLEHLVEEAIELAKADSAEDETTYDFVAPPEWRTGPEDVGRRKARLAEVEAEIDEEIYCLYGISGEDRAAIEAELAQPTAAEDGASGSSADGAKDDESTVERRDLAQRWISYAVGLLLGRFSPGRQDALGHSDFQDEVNESLAALVDLDGVATLEADHPDDLAAKVERALEIIFSEDETPRLLEAAGVAGSVNGLRRYLARDFFKEHVRVYRKRPVYWLLQSPGKTYSLYLFHERITPDTLHLLRGNRYLGGRINAASDRISELSQKVSSAPQGTEKKRLAKELDSLETHLTDLEAFSRNLADVTSRKDSEGATVGWRPELDDGVLLNLAPLHTLMPSWATEPNKAWNALESGNYDWSHTAMRYWPERVSEACRNNKSFAIAHGLLDEYAGGS